MAIDASIYNNIKPVQIDSPLASLARVTNLEGQQKQNRLSDLMLGEKERALSSENAQRDITKSSFDPATGKINPEKMRSGLAGIGDYKGLQTFETNQAAQIKTQRESEKFKIEGVLKQFEVVGQIMGGVKDQASYDIARQQISQILGPEAAAQQPAAYDPAAIEAGRAKAMSVKEQLEQKWKAMEYTTPNANAVLQASTSTDNNKRTVGASYANAEATRSVAAATRDAASIQRDQATEMKLGDDYRKQSKDFKDVGDAYRQINSTLDKATTSPAATLAAATKFMKMLDPGSVVRESELGMALAASGVFDRATNYYNVLQRGKVLTPTQVADFKNITAQIYGAAQEGQKAIDTSYTQQAKQYNLRPEMIVQDLGQNEKPKADKPSGGLKAGATQDGYRFKGGNPADKANWEKM